MYITKTFSCNIEDEMPFEYKIIKNLYIICVTIKQ